MAVLASVGLRGADGEHAHGKAEFYRPRVRGRQLTVDQPFRLGCALAAALLVSNAWWCPEARAQPPSEYHVKAVFLYNFAKFIEWPPHLSGDGNDPIALCVVGEDPFGEVLEQTIQGKTVNGHELVIERFKRGQDARGCQIAFISSSERARLRPLLESLKGTSVLTVGETQGFAQLGGVINFTVEDNNVRFEVNVEAAERAGLRISSKLLSLAKIVKDEGRGGKS